jgi:hypothetical protein
MVIHRDIKPANLLRRKDGTLAVVDFGAAHVQGATAGSTSIGTFGYMPIEQLAGLVDATTDIYALGASLVHLLSRQEPWRVVPLASTTPLNVSEPMRAFLDKLVAPLTADRFPSAEAALAALRTRDLPKPRPKRGFDHPRRPAWIIAGTLAAALVTGAAGYGVYKLSRSEPVVTPPDAMMREAIPQTPMDAALVIPPAARLPAGPAVNTEFKAMAIQDALRVLADACHVSFVLTSSIDAQISFKFTDVPCDQAIESVLESNGLGYEYLRSAKLMVIDLSRTIEEDRMLRASGWRRPDNVLPAGPNVDLDFKQAPFRDVLQAIAKTSGVNLMIPEKLNAGVTIFVKGVPWEDAVRAILHSNGMGYTYRPNGKIIRVDAQKVLDDEAHRPR